ncbi:hypothetical protein ADK46_08355 [Streptomyces rimosus subsp. rimosus]|nr:hypothetical protein ADK45_13445 [Streptomyces rimosus subsp. rimosus]KUJ40919.1 hypothetical protein ADK46_08355 [Streptomyces rimosus subsp. rimosus]
MYWTRSSNDESCHMPLPSAVERPACFTAFPKPCTASVSALATISRSTSRASASVSRAIRKPFSPKRGAGRPAAAAEARTSVSCSVTPAKSLPLLKYQSEARPAMARAAVELPPWKISGCGRDGEATGLGFSEKSRIR